jgi:hypothetical protein
VGEKFANFNELYNRDERTEQQIFKRGMQATAEKNWATISRLQFFVYHSDNRCDLAQFNQS